MAHPFQQFIERYTLLTPTEWAAIELCIHRREVKRETLLLEEGKICRHLWFLESGLLRYFIWRDGIAVTKFFTEAPYAVTSQQSFRSRTAATENIETLEDSVVWQMEAGDAYRLLEGKGWSTFIRSLVQEVQGYTEEILEDLQTQTAENRYQAMLEQQPELVRRVSLKHLASFLGIAPQSLSRIRKKLAQRTKRS